MCKLVIFTSLHVGDVEQIVNKYFVGVRLYGEIEIEQAWVFEIGAKTVSLYELEAIQYDLKELDFGMGSTCILVMI